MRLDNSSLIQSLNTLYQATPVGVMLFQMNTEAHWQLLWENPTASKQFQTSVFTTDPTFKLELFSASKSFDPSYLKFMGFELSLVAMQELELPTVLVHSKDPDLTTNAIGLEQVSDKVNHWHLDLAEIEQMTGRSETDSSAVSESLPERMPLEKFVLTENSAAQYYQRLLRLANIASFICHKTQRYMIWEKQSFITLELPKSLFAKESEGFYGAEFELFHSFIHEADQLEVMEAFQVLWEHHWPFNLQFRLRSKDHSYQWFELKVEVFDDFHIGFLKNINEQVRFKRQLKAREKLIEQLIDGLPIGIVVKDAQSSYRFVNKQVEMDFDLSRAEIIGRTDFEVFQSPEILQSLLNYRQNPMVGQLLIEEKSISLLGITQWFMIGTLSMKVENMEGRIEIWSMFFYLNITERKSIEEELKEANKKALLAAQAKSDFLSVMSHEIRTPLNSVIGNATLLMDFQLSEQTAPHVKMIQQSAEHLLYLINDILDFNKLEAGKVDLEQQPLVLQEQLETCIAMSQSPAQAKNVELSLQIFDDTTKVVLGDAGRLRQVILNLVGNAIKFSEGGRVDLLVSSNVVELQLSPELLSKLTLPSQFDTKQNVYFVVRDTGIGIDAQGITKLFQEFSQASAGTARKYGGTGLGLAICKKIVEAMHGAIGVSSVVGKGSDFGFVIPFELVNETIEYASSLAGCFSKAELDSQKPLRILVAEDNLPNQFLIRAILQKLGHEVEIVENGQKAIDSVLASSETAACFDIVLMDLSMPEMDGITATKEIRKLEQAGDLSGYTHPLPIVALTANAFDEQKDVVEDAKMDDFLTKPIDIEKLKQVLYRWTSPISA